jgi:hypothetical protein
MAFKRSPEKFNQFIKSERKSVMYKHHPYKNIVERKLEQLPAPDTDALWSSMGGILDKHLPQKKRRGGLLAWLFTQKTWMLAGVSTLVLAGFSLVYLSNKNHVAAQHASLNKPATTTASTVVSTPASSTATEDITVDQATNVTATPATTSEITTTSNTTNTVNTTAASVATAAVGTTKENTLDNRSAINTVGYVHTKSNNTGKRSDISVSTPGKSVTADPATDVAAGQSPDQAAPQSDATVMSYAATTQAIAAAEKAAPALDPSAVAVNTKALEHLSQQIATAAAVAARKRGRLPQEKGPYAGVVAGLDLSSVGLKSMKAGNNTGILVGYAFNSRWSVESGLTWSKKRYFSEGANYKPDNLTTQPGLTILDVNSSNTLYELPLNVKYNILPGTHKLFVTAGMSSYFLKREAYSVSYDLNGTQYSEYNTYANVSRHWLSVANLSLGYSYKLGSIGSIRLEPYLKLPLRDLGVGNMRVMSTGLNVGFTKMLKP